MKALLATLSFTTFILLAACNTPADTPSSGNTDGSNGSANTDNTGGSGSGGSGSGASFDAGLSSTSKFDVMVAAYVKADGSALENDREAIATDTDSAAVLELVTLDVWLKSSSTDYATYFESDGSMKEKTPGNHYIAKWYLFEEGKVGSTDLGEIRTQTRFDRVHAAFKKDGFAGGTKKATLLLRVYEPGTSDMGADKAGVQGWQLTLSESTATLDLSGVNITITNLSAASIVDDLSISSSDYSDSISNDIPSSNRTHLTSSGEQSKPHVAIKDFRLGGGKAKDLFITHLTGTNGTSSYSKTTVNPALNKHEDIINIIPYTSNVRVDFLAESGKKGKVILSIADRKLGLTQDVVLELFHTIPF